MPRSRSRPRWRPAGARANGWLHDAAGAATGLAATPVTQFWSNMSDQVASACGAMREATQAGARHGQ